MRWQRYRGEQPGTFSPQQLHNWRHISCHTSSWESATCALILRSRSARSGYISFPKTEGEDTFYSIANRLVSGECPASKTQLTHSASWAWLENAVHEQIAGILAVVEDAFVRLSEAIGRALESNFDTQVVFGKRVVNKVLAKSFWGVGFLWQCRKLYKSV